MRNNLHYTSSSCGLAYLSVMEISTYFHKKIIKTATGSMYSSKFQTIIRNDWKKKRGKKMLTKMV